MGNCCTRLYRWGFSDEFETSLKRPAGPGGDLQHGQTAEAEALWQLSIPSAEKRAQQRELVQKMKAAPTRAEKQKIAIAAIEEYRSSEDMSMKVVVDDDNEMKYESMRTTPPMHWITPRTGEVYTSRVVYYIHGGGLVWGNFSSYGKNGFAVLLARWLRTKTLYVDYRLLPEFTVADALEDVMAGYKQAVDSVGGRADRVIVAGESSGGYLTLRLLIECKKRGLPQPGCAVAISPDTDITLSAPSHHNNQSDIMSPEDMEVMQYIATDYGTIDPKSISPLFEDLTGLCPVLCQVGGIEVSVDDPIRFVDKAKAAGVDAECQVWTHMYHVWQLFHKLHPEGGAALDQIARWVDAKTPPHAGAAAPGAGSAAAAASSASAQV